MKRKLFLLISISLAINSWGSTSSNAKDAGFTAVSIRIEEGPGQFFSPGVGAFLVGPDATRQLVITARSKSGGQADYSRRVEYGSFPEGIVSISPSGLIRPLSDGTTTVTAASIEGLESHAVFTIKNSNRPATVNFPNEIVPIFTKYGCNGGGCHGKSGGQNGFRLSLLGFEPSEDYEYLVKESRGRRVFPAAPDHSLLLMKSTGILPHGGGKRFKVDSYAYRLLRRWIEQGMPYGSPKDPVVTEIQVFPKASILPRGGRQQLSVTAFYSDGSTQDVTRIVKYEANQKDMAESTDTGLVTVFDYSGDTAVMIRFREFVDVFRATIPLGAPMSEMPPIANLVDRAVFNKLELLGLPPSPLCNDATFLRRTSLDITGKLPAPEAIRTFRNDSRADKRSQWVNQLLENPAYADFFAGKWSSILRNKRSKGNYAHGTQSFYNWIRQGLYTNKPYDQFLRELVSASGDINQNPPVAWYRHVDKTEERLQDIAQVFLGIRLQCARCHHHPYEKWSQKDYYGFSAFFSRVSKKQGRVPGEEIIYHKRGKASAKHPKSGKTVYPTALDGPTFEVLEDQDPRRQLADWITEKNNPFFSRMLVNRYWKHFFGRGLVEPEDDLRSTNPATNPELLQNLADNFEQTGFNLKELIRTLCNSTTYQLTSLPNEFNADDKQNFSRYFPKRLQAEVLLDLIDQLTESSTSFAGMPANTKAVQLPDDSFTKSSYFLSVFGRPEMASACECERTQDSNLAQSLHLLNSKSIQEKLTSPNGRATRLAMDSAQLEQEKINDLYLAAFCRDPEKGEMETALSYLKKKRLSREEDATLESSDQQAFEDIIWALMNTKEFLFNH